METLGSYLIRTTGAQAADKFDEDAYYRAHDVGRTRLLAFVPVMATIAVVFVALLPWTE